jgi:methylated-DNA-[protein]-cysteine S-methyltransferase
MLDGMKTQQIRYTVFETAWGYAGFASSANGITRLHLPVPTRDAAIAKFTDAIFDARLMKELQKMVSQYFEGKDIDFRRWPKVDCSPQSSFAGSVLKECRKIRYGQVITYRELAQRAGSPAAARAAGTVLARNPVPLIVPCHRIIRTDGALGGFSGEGGVKMKKRLLNLEDRERSGSKNRIR